MAEKASIRSRLLAHTHEGGADQRQQFGVLLDA
jgi:hypothetical protein